MIGEKGREVIITIKLSVLMYVYDKELSSMICDEISTTFASSKKKIFTRCGIYCNFQPLGQLQSAFLRLDTFKFFRVIVGTSSASQHPSF